MTDFPPGVDWAAIAANFPRVIADLLSDHNLANHPLAIIPTMDDGHIPDLETLSYGGAFADGQIPNLDVAKITSGRFGMARMPAGTATYILTAQGAGADPAYAAPPAADVGGLYGINVEVLAAAKTLTANTDVMYQYLDPGGANRTITLSTVDAVAGNRFIIRNQDAYSHNAALAIYQGANKLDDVYANSIVEFIYNGSSWIAAVVGTGQYLNSLNRNIGIGYKARAHQEGVAIGYDAQGWRDAVAIGSTARAYTYGTAIGYGARGYDYGVALGKSAYGYNRGLALGFNVNSGNLFYSIALGYYSRCTRTAETAVNIDGGTTYKNQVVQGRWFGTTSDATPTELSLGNRGGQRFTMRYASAFAFKGMVVATTQATPGTPNVTSSWEVKGLIKRDADNNVTLVGATHAVINQDGGAAAWDAVFSADDTNEALILTVTGAAGTTIRWAAFIDAVEIAW